MSIMVQINRFLRNPGKPVILAMSRPDAKKNILGLVSIGRTELTLFLFQLRAQGIFWTGELPSVFCRTACSVYYGTSLALLRHCSK